MIKEKYGFLDSKNIRVIGLPDYYVKSVCKNHLINPALWEKCVEAFKTKQDSTDNGWRCEYWGKTMRGAALCYYYLKDENLYAVLEQTVKDLLSVQEKDGRISSYTKETEFNGWDLWGRKYVITGLLHFKDICKSKEFSDKITVALDKHIRYIINRVGDGEDKKDILKTSTAWGAVNSCTILEPILDAYVRTGEKDYLDFAEYIISTGGSSLGSLIDAVRQGKKPVELPVLKAYEVMSFFEGLLLYYRISGNTFYLETVKQFVKSIKENEITVIGCAGCWNEEFNNAAITQTEPPVSPTQETCVTVTYIRLLTKLYKLTGNVEYMDDIENAVINGLNGSVNVYRLESVRKGTTEAVGTFAFDSYSPLLNGVRNQGVGGIKDLAGKGYYGCCACIGSVALALVPLLQVLKTDGGFVVNEYYGGVANIGKTKLRFKSAKCLGDAVKIFVEGEEIPKGTLTLRIPDWANAATVVVGENAYQAENGTFTIVETLKDGDVIKLQFNPKLKKINVNGRTALKYGGYVLARDNKKERIKTTELSKTNINFGADLKIERKKPKKFESVRCYVSDANGKILLTDYASCGKRWDKFDNYLTVWFDN